MKTNESHAPSTTVNSDSTYEIMPRFLKLVYIGGATLASIALLIGFYEYVIARRESASFASDVFLPLTVLVVIAALYLRRKRQMEGRRRR